MDTGVPLPDETPEGSLAELTSALPSTGARTLAFAAIVVAGLCGGLIGWAVADLQTHSGSSAWSGVGALVGAVIAAGGVAVVAVLALRAMGEWQSLPRRTDPPVS